MPDAGEFTAYKISHISEDKHIGGGVFPVDQDITDLSSGDSQIHESTEIISV